MKYMLHEINIFISSIVTFPLFACLLLRKVQILIVPTSSVYKTRHTAKKPNFTVHMFKFVTLSRVRDFWSNFSFLTRQLYDSSNQQTTALRNIIHKTERFSLFFCLCIVFAI
jgi:hypothetical protein